MHCQQLDEHVSSAWITQAVNLNCLPQDPQWNEIQLLSACHGNELVFAVIENERLLGYLVVAVVLDEAEIHTVLVDQQQRGKGIAKTMLSHLMTELDKQGVAQVFLEVRQSNVAAIGLYARFGFYQVGQRKGYYKNADGSREDALLMQWTEGSDPSHGSDPAQRAID